MNPTPTDPREEPFQSRVLPWLLACFGQEIANDKVERNHRFIEEALELVQSTGCTRSEALQLVDYVFDRPAGIPNQEVGGVMVTLAALCLAQGLDMHHAGEQELARIWTKVEKIREKQAAKPKHSPLPAAHESTTSNLAAEIAELKANCAAMKEAMSEAASSVMNALQLEDPNFQRGELEKAYGLLDDALKLPAGQTLLDKLGDTLDQRDALRAELEAARKELEMARKLPSTPLKLLIQQRDTALAAKAELEKHGRYVLRFASSWPCWCDDEMTCDACATEKDLRALLTPAPTQEPPAGGVTISTAE